VPVVSKRKFKPTSCNGRNSTQVPIKTHSLKLTAFRDHRAVALAHITLNIAQCRLVLDAAMAFFFFRPRPLPHISPASRAQKGVPRIYKLTDVLEIQRSLKSLPSCVSNCEDFSWLVHSMYVESLGRFLCLHGEFRPPPPTIPRPPLELFIAFCHSSGDFLIQTRAATDGRTHSVSIAKLKRSFARHGALR